LSIIAILLRRAVWAKPALLALVIGCVPAACSAESPARGGGLLAQLAEGDLAPQGKAPPIASPYGAYLAGLVAQSDGDLDAAADYMLQALIFDPDNPELLYPALQLAAATGRREETVRLAARIHAAKQLFLGNARRIMACGRTGAAMSVQERADCRNNVAFAVQLSYEAMETIFFAAGGSSLALDNPIQRAMRDMHAVKAHYFMDIETTRELAGMIRLGKVPFTYIF